MNDGPTDNYGRKNRDCAWQVPFHPGYAGCHLITLYVNHVARYHAA